MKPVCPSILAHLCLCAFTIIFHTQENSIDSILLQVISHFLRNCKAPASHILEIFFLKCLIFTVHSVIFSFLFHQRYITYISIYYSRKFTFTFHQICRMWYFIRKCKIHVTDDRNWVFWSCMITYVEVF